MAKQFLANGHDVLIADKVLPSAKNKIMGAIADALPDTAAAAVHRGMSEPGSANR